MLTHFIRERRLGEFYEWRVSAVYNRGGVISVEHVDDFAMYPEWGEIMGVMGQ